MYIQVKICIYDSIIIIIRIFMIIKARAYFYKVYKTWSFAFLSSRICSLWFCLLFLCLAVSQHCDDICRCTPCIVNILHASLLWSYHLYTDKIAVIGHPQQKYSSGCYYAKRVIHCNSVHWDNWIGCHISYAVTCLPCDLQMTQPY